MPYGVGRPVVGIPAQTRQRDAEPPRQVALRSQRRQSETAQFGWIGDGAPMARRSTPDFFAEPSAVTCDPGISGVMPRAPVVGEIVLFGFFVVILFPISACVIGG